MTTITENFYNYDDTITSRVENTFESFLENYFNNIIVHIEEDDYVDLESILNTFDATEEVITTFDNLTQFQRLIVNYLSCDKKQQVSQESEMSQKEKCESEGLEYNEHKDNCCNQGQEYYRQSKRCRKKQRKRVSIDENITVIEQCAQQGVAYNTHTKKCCNPGQEYIEGNKRCTKSKKRSPPPPPPSGPTHSPSIVKIPEQNDVQHNCTEQGLSYNPVNNKCCSSKSLEYISGKKCSKKNKPRSPSGPVITSPKLDNNNNIKQQCIDKGLAYNENTKKCCANKDQEYKSGNKRCTKKK